MTGNRFLCDAMLAGLGKWLRAAGYDTAYAPARHVDRTLVRLAHDEHRLLLTCDRKILEIRGAGAVTRILRAQGVDGQAAELTAAVGIDWLHDPLSRCLICNTVLETAGDAVFERVPRDVRTSGGPFTCCPACGRVYWPGGHHDRILQRLQAFVRNAKR
jgi:hypothetical protein